MQIHYRDDEAIYIQAFADRVTVIFSTTFKDDTDSIFAKVFLQEFADARRQPGLQNSPQVLHYPKDPPTELKDVKGLKTENTSFITFVLNPRHYDKKNREMAISLIQTFRDYLHYHIKCSKAYMHSRMRARVESLLKVLNRAKPDIPVERNKTAWKVVHQEVSC
jgi:actin related protein 2/3 complex subunit 2